MAYIATGFSGGKPTWSTGKVVAAVGRQPPDLHGAMSRLLARLRARGRSAQRGFTLIELLMGIVLASVFALALFALLLRGPRLGAHQRVAGERPVDRPHGDRPARRATSARRSAPTTG